MAKLDPGRLAEKFGRKIAQAGPDYDYGIANPARDWESAYKAASERMKAELARALAENKHLKGAAEAGTAKWQSMAKAKGSARYTQAAAIAAEEYSKVASDIVSAAEKARAAAEALPDTTLEERLNRARAAMLAIHEHWQK